MSAFACHICGAPGIDLVPGYETLCRVTSDCQPWPRGGRLAVCRVCGCVQKPVDPEWQSEIEKIYDAYSIYHQAAGSEQSVFEAATGAAASRSSHLLRQLRAHVPLPESGRLLDLGCGNGAFLRAASDALTSWLLAGTELGEKYRAVVEGIRGVEALYTCPPKQVPGTFDLITMVHVLEHIPSPKGFLTGLQDKLNPDGLLLIEVPNYSQNPFDLLIADHCSHFSPATLSYVIQDAGYELKSVASDWVPKELSGLARRARGGSAEIVPDAEALRSVSNNIRWLKAVVADATRLSSNTEFGLFGTSIAATWLACELQERVRFFVDEDPARVGRQYMRKPVYHPSAVPPGSRVLIAFPPHHSANLRARLLGYAKGYELILPPVFPVPAE